MLRRILASGIAFAALSTRASHKVVVLKADGKTGSFR